MVETIKATGFRLPASVLVESGVICDRFRTRWRLGAPPGTLPEPTLLRVALCSKPFNLLVTYKHTVLCHGEQCVGTAWRQLADVHHVCCGVCITRYHQQSCHAQLRLPRVMRPRAFTA